MKIVSKITYSLKQGLKGIYSNKTMSFISIVSVTSVLVILGIVLCIVLNINSFMHKTQNEVNEIRVALDSSLSKDDTLYIKKELENMSGVESVKYQTKDEAFDSMKESFGEDKELLEEVKNPLDNYYIVTINNVKAKRKSNSIFSNQNDQTGALLINDNSNIISLNYLGTSNIVASNSWIRGQLIFICE